MGRKTKLNAERTQIIVDTISAGGTDEMAFRRANISQDCFYRWLREGESSRNGAKKEFYESVTRARQQANLLAVIAFRTGLQESQVYEEIRDTFSETRLDAKGNPYQYTKTTKREKITRHPPDWRAGEAWLKRRDKTNWSDKITVEHEDWQSKAIEYIKAGELSFEVMTDEFGHDLATQLFAAAGVPCETGNGEATQ